MENRALLVWICRLTTLNQHEKKYPANFTVTPKSFPQAIIIINLFWQNFFLFPSPESEAGLVTLSKLLIFHFKSLLMHQI